MSPSIGKRCSRERGVTILEIVISVLILGLLAAVIVPLSKTTTQRQKEIQLRQALRTIREAIDEYKQLADQGVIADQDVSAMGFPPDLEILVDGVETTLDAGLVKTKFMRRIPLDPMTNSTEWGLISYQDEPTSLGWGRENVFDVYTESKGTALDGTKYRDW